MDDASAVPQRTACEAIVTLAGAGLRSADDDSSLAARP